MGDLVYIIAGALVLVAILAVYLYIKRDVSPKIRRSTETGALVPYVYSREEDTSFEDYEYFVDDCIERGEVKECFREFLLMTCIKIKGLPEAVSDEKMEDMLLDLFDEKIITLDEVYENLEIYKNL